MIVIPMAGLSSRFTKAGFTKPKFMLPIAGKSMFELCLSSFQAYFKTEKFIFIGVQMEGLQSFIEDTIGAMKPGPLDYDVVLLPNPTNGQAETVALGLKQLNFAVRGSSLTVFNIDTYRPGFTLPPAVLETGCDGYVEVFRGDGEHWSFVLPEDNDRGTDFGTAARVTEKVRISDLCSTGLYYFRDVSTFFELFEEMAARPASSAQGGEYYIAPLYNQAIERGQKVCFNVIGNDEVVFLGTPAEYEAAKAQLEG